MTAKQPTPMPEGIIRPKAPAAPRKDNIFQLPTKPKMVVAEIKVRIETTVLEDGSVWWRVENLINGKFGEWTKNGEDE